MKLALIGYGKMGKAIEAIAIDRGHTVVARFDSKTPVTVEALSEADVAIEFTRPELAFPHIKTCFEANVPIIVGTTGWYQHFEEVKQLATDKSGLFYATNFSLGVNLFFQMNKQLAKMMGNYPEYGVSMKEIHHTQKLDEPSGTAISIANQIIDNHAGKNEWVLGHTKEADKIPIEAEREGMVPGTHIVTYTSDIDKIEIKHEAFNRTGFAFGSVLAAEFMNNKSGFYNMENLLNAFSS